MINGVVERFIVRHAGFPKMSFAEIVPWSVHRMTEWSTGSFVDDVDQATESDDHAEPCRSWRGCRASRCDEAVLHGATAYGGQICSPRHVGS